MTYNHARPFLRCGINLTIQFALLVSAYADEPINIGSRRQLFVGQDMIEISKFLRVATGYRVDLQP